jgi:mono/diheme cytochrome c family protein
MASWGRAAPGYRTRAQNFSHSKVRFSFWTGLSARELHDPFSSCENILVISRASFTSSLLYLGLIATVIPAALAAFPNTEELAKEKAGAGLYRDKGCAYCHGADGTGTKKAPALTDLWKDKTWTDEKLTSQILDGGKKMPPFRDSVTDDELADLIAFLRAKTKPEPPPAEGDSTQPAPQP